MSDFEYAVCKCGNSKEEFVIIKTIKKLQKEIDIIVKRFVKSLKYCYYETDKCIYHNLRNFI